MEGGEMDPPKGLINKKSTPFDVIRMKSSCIIHARKILIRELSVYFKDWFFIYFFWKISFFCLLKLILHYKTLK